MQTVRGGSKSVASWAKGDGGPGAIPASRTGQRLRHNPRLYCAATPAQHLSLKQAGERGGGGDRWGCGVGVASENHNPNAGRGGRQGGARRDLRTRLL